MMRDDDRIVLPPRTHMLESLRAFKPNYIILIGEALDNSFDANSRNIIVEITDERIAFTDDGDGITVDREEAVMTLGGHGAMASTLLGRYGIGIKYQAIAAGDLLHYRSISTNGQVRIKMDWFRMLREGKWSYDKPQWVTTLPTTPTGTTVVISGLRGKPITPALEAKIRDDISERFHPALTNGCNIIFNGSPVKAIKDPELTDIVDEHLTFSNGKSARVRGGLLINQNSKLRMVHISVGWRVILARTGFGCGEITGPMFARIELFGPWKLAPFKDGINDDDEDDLDQRVQEVLAPILDKCRSRTMSATIDELTNLINEMLPPDLVPVRPQRRRDREEQEEPPKKRRRRSPGIDKDAPETPTGPARSMRAPRDRLLICFEEPLHDQFGYGKFDAAAKPKRVSLAADNPRIKELIRHRDKSGSARTLYEIAMNLYLHSRFQQQLELELEEYGKRLWNLIALQTIQDEESEA